MGRKRERIGEKMVSKKAPYLAKKLRVYVYVPKKQEENQSLTSDFNGGCCVWKKGDCRRKKKKESSPKGGRDEEEKTERWQIQNLSEMGGHRELKIS